MTAEERLRKAAELEAQRGKKDDSMAMLQVVITALFALYSEISANIDVHFVL